MARPFQFLLFISCFLLSIPIVTSVQIYCEATPVEYDQSFSVFCQEDDLAQNLTKSSQNVLFPDLTPSLKKSVLTDGSEDENGNVEIPDGHAHNYTFLTVDPRNVSDLSVWAKFDEIPTDAFAKFPNLRQLHVAQYYDDTSRAVLLRQHAFRGLPQLEWLGLHLNFSHVQIPDAVFEVTSLISLGLYESDLNHLDFSLRGNLPKLKLLTVYDSPNMGLDDDAFKNVANTLNEIDFSNIKLQKFPKAISELKNLTRVEVASTGLQEIPPEAFAKSAGSLVIIRLSRNHISVVHPTSFRGLSKLKVLQLAYNQIEVIPAGMFNDLVALEVLNLSGNKIKALPAGIFDLNKHLHILDLDENPMNASSSEYLKDKDKNDAIEYTEGEDDEDKQKGTKIPKKEEDNEHSGSEETTRATTTPAGTKSPGPPGITPPQTAGQTTTTAPEDDKDDQQNATATQKTSSDLPIQASTIQAAPVKPTPAPEPPVFPSNGSRIIDLTGTHNITVSTSENGHEPEHKVTDTGFETGLHGNNTDVDHNATDTEKSGMPTGSSKGLTEKGHSGGSKKGINVVLIALLVNMLVFRQ